MDCQGSSVVNDMRTSCLACMAGFGPNNNRTSCVACEGTTFSQVGICQECPYPNVVNIEASGSHATSRVKCTPCMAGEGPNERHDGCVRCVTPEYSNAGVCILCLEPRIPILGNTMCSETVCAPGTTCPVQDLDNDGQLDSCDEESDCEQCPVGFAGLGGDCTFCNGTGSVANRGQSACEQCSAGKQPNANHSGCDSCSFNTYSTFGYVCNHCELPSAVNVERTNCARCAPGEGTVCQSSQNNLSAVTQCDSSDWVCSPCRTTDYSPVRKHHPN